LIEKKDNPYPELEPSPLYFPLEDSLDLVFAEELTRVKGEFIFCESEQHFIQNFQALLEEKGWREVRVWETGLKKILDRNKISYNSDLKNLEPAEAGFTLCEALIARNGSILMSTGQESGRGLMILPTVHIVLAFQSQLVQDLKDGFSLLRKKYPEEIPSSIVCITGPSRTADIEKTLVLGAHGPKSLIVFLLEEV